MKKIFLLFVRIFYSSISLIFTLITAKILTLNDYKQSVELIVIISIMAPIVSFGVGPLIVRKGQCSDKVLFSRLFNGWFLGLILSFILSLISYWFYPELYYYIFLLLVLNNTSFVISERYRARNDFFQALLYSNGSPSSGVISLGLLSNIVFLLLGACALILNVKVSFALVVIGTIISIIFTILIPWCRIVCESRIRINKKWLFAYSKSGLSISVIYFLFSFIANSDLLLISHVADESLIYDYSLAFKLAVSCLVVHTFFASMAQVEFVTNGYKINQKIKKLYAVSITISIFAIIFLNVFSVLILHLFGVNPHDVTTFRFIILIKSIGSLFYIMLGFNAAVLLINNKFLEIIKACLIFCFVFAFCYLLFGFVDFKIYNLILFSWIISYSFYSLFLYLYAKRKKLNG